MTSAKVLLLDDDASSVAELDAALRELGFEIVLVAANDTLGVSHALRRLAVEPMPLLLVSVVAPRFAGLATFELIRRDERARSTSLVLLSTSFATLEEHARSPLPADGYVQRPTVPDALAGALRRCFDLLSLPPASTATPVNKGPTPPTPEAEGIDIATEDPASTRSMREAQLANVGPVSRRSAEELRERLREGKNVLAQLQERLYSQREEHRAALERAERGLAAAISEKDAASERALLYEAQTFRLEAQLESTVEQLMATTREHRKLDAVRAQPTAETVAQTAADHQAAIDAAVAEATRKLREDHAEVLAAQTREHATAFATEAREHAAAFAAEAREYTATIERLTATLERERQERASATEAARAEIESGAATRKKAEAAHAAALGALEASREEERAAAKRQLEAAQHTGSQTSQSAVRDAQREHDEITAAMVRAHESELARERALAESARATTLEELQAARSELTRQREADATRAALLEDARRVADDARTLLAGEQARAAAAATKAAQEAAAAHSKEVLELAASEAEALARATSLAGKLEAETKRAQGLADALRETELARQKLVADREVMQRDVAGLRETELAKQKLVADRAVLEREVEAERKLHKDALANAEKALLPRLQESEAALGDLKAKFEAGEGAARQERGAHTAALAAAEERARQERVAHAAALAAAEDRVRQERVAHTAALAAAEERARSALLAKEREWREQADQQLAAGLSKVRGDADEKNAALASEQVARAAAEAALAKLRTVHAAELAELDRSVAHILEQERAEGERSVAETRAAAIQAVSIGVSAAQRASKEELKQRLAERDRAHSTALEAERARAEAERDDGARDLQREVARSTAIEAQLRSEQTAHVAAMAAVDEARKEEAARAKAALAAAEATFEVQRRELSDTRDREAREAQALVAQRDREHVAQGAALAAAHEAREVEERRVKAAFAETEAAFELRRRELVDAHARQTAETEALAAQLDRERSAHAAAVTAGDDARKAFDAERRELADAREREAAHARELAAQIEQERSAHAAAFAAADAARKTDAARAATAIEGERRELAQAREREAAQAMAFSDERGRQEAAHAAALAALRDELERRLSAADQALGVERDRAATALASAEAAFEAQRRALVTDRETEMGRARSLEEQLASDRAAHAAALAVARDDLRAVETAAANTLKEQQAQAATALAAKEAYFETERSTLVLGRDSEANRARSLEEQLASDRAAHAAALAVARDDLRAVEAAAANTLKEQQAQAAAALGAKEAGFETERSALVLGRDSETGRATSLEAKLAEKTSAHAEATAAADDLRARLHAADESRKAEQERAVAVLASKETAFETERRALVLGRNTEAARATLLEKKLADETVAHAAAAGAAADLRVRSEAADASRKIEQERAASALASKEAAFDTERSALAVERDREAARATSLEQKLVNDSAAHAAAAANDIRARSQAADELRKADQERAAATLAAKEAAFEAERSALILARDREATRATSLEQKLTDATVAHTAAAAAAGELEARLKTEQRRATTALAAAMVDFDAQRRTLEEERESALAVEQSREEQLRELRAAHDALVAEHERLLRQPVAPSPTPAVDATSENDLRAHAAARLALEAIQTEHAAALAAAAVEAGRLRQTEGALMDERARSAALSRALKTARDAEQKLGLERVAEHERLAQVTAASERYEAALAEAGRELARAREDASARAAELGERYEAGLAEAGRELSREREDGPARAAELTQRFEAALAREREDAAAQVAELTEQYEVALADAGLELTRAREDAPARAAELRERYEAALADAGRELARERQEASARAAELNVLRQADATAFSRENTRLVREHEALVLGLREEVVALREALSADRQQRTPMSARPRTGPDKARPSAEYQFVAPDGSRSSPESGRPLRARPSGEFRAAAAVARDPHDPREIVRRVLLRSLAEAQAELAITMALAAAGRRDLPSQRDELLALIERYLLSELIGHLGNEQANKLMDELGAALAEKTAHEEAAAEVHPLTTKPPPELKSRVSTLRPSVVPESDMPRPTRADRRSVLVIDKDRTARAGICRALIGAGCEVTARESCVDIARAIHEFDVIVTEVLGVAVEELLTTFAQRPPKCGIVGWTTETETARAMFNAAGLRGVAIVSKESRPDTLVATVRTSLGEVPSAARG